MKPPHSTDRNTGPVVVTGARGRLAGPITEALRKLGHEVLLVSRTADEHRISWEDAFRDKVFRNARTVLHLAWGAVPLSAENQVERLFAEDLPLLARLCVAMTEGSEPRPHLIYFSSGGAIYGDSRADRPSTEESVPHPKGWYGSGKQLAEGVIQQFGTHAALPFTLLRVANPYGFPHDPSKPQGIVGAAIHSLKTGSPLTIWGDGQMAKDYLHIEDLCSAVAQVVQEPLDGTYNVCTGTSHTVLDVLEVISQAAGRPVPCVWKESAPWDVANSHLSPDKFHASTGWMARIPFRQGVETLVQYSLAPSRGTTPG